MNSCFEHSPFRYSHSFPTPASQCSFRSPFLSKDGHIQRKNRTVMACRQENSKNRDYCTRRVIIFTGFAVIPVLNMRADAFEGLTAENTELRTQDQDLEEKQPIPENSSTNSFFSLVNTLGFLGCGVLSALYASTKKEKDIADATIDSMNIKLNEKEAAISSLEKKLEAELSNEKEVRGKALAKANEEHRALLSQLKNANDTITSIGHELEKQRRSDQELTFQVDDLNAKLCGAHDEKTELQKNLKEKLDSLSALQERTNLLYLEIEDKEDNLLRLNLKFAEKERELDRLSSVYQQSEDQVTKLNSETEKLKLLVSENEKELELKNEAIDKQNAELSVLFAEKNETSKKLDSVKDEEKIRLFEEQIKFSLDELRKNEGLVSDLTREKDELKEMMGIESKKARNLEEELKTTHDALEKSRNEASELSEQLQQSRNLCSEFETEISKAQAEFNETKEFLQRNIFETKQEVENLSGELKSAKELLHESNEELQTTSQKRDSLEKELVNAHEKAESAIFYLNEEKKTTSSLNNELKILETQISEDREFRKKLESDLGEANKSLDEMNRNALMLSGELELANSRISSLEDEKDAAYNALDEQKRASQEARENLEDAHVMVMRLGKERERLEKRGKKLEEELASAKGKILRLRSRISSSKILDNNVGIKKNKMGKGCSWKEEEEEEEVAFGITTTTTLQQHYRLKGSPPKWGLGGRMYATFPLCYKHREVVSE